MTQEDRHLRVRRKYPVSPGAITNMTQGLLLLAFTEEAVRLQCEIDALYWNLAQQGKLKWAVSALRRGQLDHQEDRKRIYG